MPSVYSASRRRAGRLQIPGARPRRHGADRRARRPRARAPRPRVAACPICRAPWLASRRTAQPATGARGRRRSPCPKGRGAGGPKGHSDRPRAERPSPLGIPYGASAASDRGVPGVGGPGGRGAAGGAAAKACCQGARPPLEARRLPRPARLRVHRDACPLRRPRCLLQPSGAAAPRPRAAQVPSAAHRRLSKRSLGYPAVSRTRSSRWWRPSSTSTREGRVESSRRAYSDARSTGSQYARLPSDTNSKGGSILNSATAFWEPSFSRYPIG
jgi:hypothetical protein